MRILYVIERLSGKGGLQRVIIDKMNYLAEHTAHEVVLMTVWHDTKSLAFPLSDKVRTVKLNVPLPPVPLGYMIMLPLALYRFNKYVKKLSPDISILFRAVGAFLIASTSWRGKKIYESHLALSHMNHGWIYKYMERKADKIVCLTKGDSSEFSIQEKVTVIPNFTTFTSTTLPDYASKRCMWVGRLAPQKNPERLIDIWAEVHKRQSEWQLDIYGDGPLRSRIESKIREKGLTGSVRMFGHIENIKEKYSESSILIMTSRSEGLPMALIEASTCGLPLVAFDCPYGPADVISQGKNGFLIEYDSNNSMIEAVCKLMNNEEMRINMGHRGRELAKQYQPATIMSRWIKLFVELTSDRA